MIPDLFKQKIIWQDIKINNDVYMISSIREMNIVKVFLTNLVEIWSETFSDEIIFDRCKKLNALLNVEAAKCIEIVNNILNNISQHVDEASVEHIKLRVHLEGGSMKFALYLTKAPPEYFWEIITKPLCVSSMEIIRQNKILLDLIKRKDEEIAEYKAEGAELIRKNIETKTFNEDQLKVDIPIPNIAKCADAFQTMVNFYNALNLCEHREISTEPSSSTSTNNKAEQMEQSLVTLGDNDNSSTSKESVDNDILMYRKLPALKSKKQKKSTDEVMNKKGIAISMIHKRIKKPKKNNFI